MMNKWEAIRDLRMAVDKLNLHDNIYIPVPDNNPMFNSYLESVTVKEVLLELIDELGFEIGVSLPKDSQVIVTKK